MMEFDETFDWVVVGSGGGALCSALVMRKSGKSVLILEKSEFIGGTTCKSGGTMWIPNNRFMQRDGVEDSPENARLYLDDLVSELGSASASTPGRRDAYIREAPRMLDFLVEQGADLDRIHFWPDYYDDRPGGIGTSRSVVPKLFDLNRLGPWKRVLRQGFLGNLPATIEESMRVPSFKQSWKVKGLMVKIGLRAIFSRLMGKHYVGAGAALQGWMLCAALEAGADVRSQAAVTELIFEDGRMSGVAFDKDGVTRRVGARLGILVNAGGFSQNQAMRDQYQPGTCAKWSMATEGDTGEMILEMERHGAVLAQMDTMAGFEMTTAPGWETAYVKPSAQGITAKPHAILVDQSGVRYMGEGGSYELYCRTMLQRNKAVPAVPSWAIFDSSFIDNYMLANTMPGRRKPKNWREEGYLRWAETINELASQLDIDPATLRDTVDRFNGFVDKNCDEDFHRGEREYDKWLGDPFHLPSHSLGRIDRAPFYAVPVVPGDIGTFGGVLTDEHARVLSQDGTPIPGLYATGVCTASVFGGCYPGPGASVGPSFTFGYVAAKHAASRNIPGLTGTD